MILEIDTTKREKILLGLYDGKIEECFEFATNHQSEDLLVAIEGILKKNNIELKDLKAILVNRGPGSFTGTRAGITVANTLAWTLDIPVFGYRDGEREKELKRALKSKQKIFSKIVLPYYES